MPPHPRPPIASILLALLLPVAASAAELRTDAYRLPLVDPYAIYCSDRQLSVSADQGLYRLVEVMPSRPGAGLSTHTLVPKVESVAVHDRIIFGKTTDGFFIFDARRSDPQPQVIPARPDWEIALRSLGISDPNVAKPPDELAAAVSEQILRPWKYQSLGRFGIADDVLSLATQLFGLALAFVLGLAWPRHKSTLPAALAFGLIVNVVAQILIAGGGPGACVGFVALPLLCMVAAALGKSLRARRPADA
jgi:hypothetical protein